MKNNKDTNPGGVNGLGEGKINSTELALIRQRISEASISQTRSQILENKVMSIKLKMIAYLDDPLDSKIIEAGLFLKNLLDALEIQQKRFAEYVSYHPANLSALLSGRRKMNNQLAIKLDEIFNVGSELWMKIQTKNDLIESRKTRKAQKGKYRLRDLIEI